MAEQLTMDALLATGLCNYGLPKPGEVRPCSEPVTHAAVWEIPPTYLDGEPNPRAGTGRIECCRQHADYYATSWAASGILYPYSCDRAWIDVL